MTKQELRAMIEEQTATFLASGGEIKRKNRVVWAKGAKLKRNKSISDVRSKVDGAVGFVCTNHSKMENSKV